MKILISILLLAGIALVAYEIAYLDRLLKEKEPLHAHATAHHPSAEATAP